MIVIPTLLGSEVCSLLKIKNTLPKSFVFGTITTWAVCQIISVPLILFKQSFTVVVVLQSVIVVLLCAHGIYKKRIPKIAIEKHSIVEILGLIFMIAMACYMIIPQIGLQLTNADDSRFVVNAVDIVRTNRLLLTDVNTGKEIYSWIGDLHKDVASPWPVYIAYLSKITGIHVATMCHTILPPILLLMVCCIYWMFSEEFFEEEKLNRYIFVAIVILLTIYGHYSVYSSETFVLSRIWQGKSVITAIAIPLLILCMMWIYKEVSKENAWSKQYITLLLCSIAFGLPSNMGFLITCVMLGCFGLVYGICKKSMKVMLGIWLSCVPNLIYLYISYSIKP